MSFFSQESLERLKGKIDLLEVLSSHVKLQRSGGYYKACCPFHEEKTPSFVIQTGDSHYHCFGCGAHGDAIAFLMGYQKLSFKEAVEYLAEKFQVPLELKEEEKGGTNKKLLKEVLYQAQRFYHFCLLHTEEGHRALSYLYHRGFSLSFIEKFQLGFSLKGDLLKRFLLSLGHPEELLVEAGLLQALSKRDFFYDRVMIPIHDPLGQTIGFSARKIDETTFGGKYVYTPETPLFKKSSVLFGLSYSRSKIAKERKAIVVEGQFDALRLIDEGFDYTVAGQGTAFGEGHVKELMNLGVTKVYLCFDGDSAGQKAAIKVGHLFQKKGVEVRITLLKEGQDPDAYLKTFGKKAFEEEIQKSQSYLRFFYDRLATEFDVLEPTQKNQLVSEIAAKIKEWEHPVLVFESLKELAHIAEVPEGILGIHRFKEPSVVKKNAAVKPFSVDGDRILEVDLLRWALVGLQQDPSLFSLIERNVAKETFTQPLCSSFYEKLQLFSQKTFDMMAFGASLEENEQKIFSDIAQKRINRLKAKEGVIETLNKLLTRNWMKEREELKKEIERSDEEKQMELSRKLSLLIKTPPLIRE